MATWIAAADTAGVDVTGVTDCTDNLLVAEGAPDEFPNGVNSCSISYDAGQWTVTTSSDAGGTYTVTY